MSPQSVALVALLTLVVGCSAEDAPKLEQLSAQSSEPQPSLAHATSSAPVPEISLQGLDVLAEAILAQRYGDSARDENLDCWRDEVAAEVPYCMRVAQVRRVDEQGRSVLYVLASNINRFDLPDYQYAVADPGRAAAFAASIGPDGALGEIFAAGNGFSFGTNGNCGCDDATLVRLGAEKHAWHFVSGGIWQGTVVTNHVLLSRVGEAFADLSQIPEISEDDQSHRISISVDESDLSRNAFPVIATMRAMVQTIAANPPIEGELIAQWVISPSDIDGVYRIPVNGVVERKAGDRP